MTAIDSMFVLLTCEGKTWVRQVQTHKIWEAVAEGIFGQFKELTDEEMEEVLGVVKTLLTGERANFEYGTIELRRGGIHG